jgi:hypothetical protein
MFGFPLTLTMNKPTTNVSSSYTIEESHIEKKWLGTWWKFWTWGKLQKVIVVDKARFNGCDIIGKNIWK